jgi:nicotinamide-nucleotide amidase
LRFFGPSESTVASVLDESGGEAEGLEVTVCARDFEIHVDLFAEEGALERGVALERSLRERFGDQLFAQDERPVEEIVLSLARERGLSIATAESCTGGLIATRLTEVPGASDVFLGGVVAYSNTLKEHQLGVPESVVESRGAVSPETAEAMAQGARARLGADVAVAVTGIAGPSGAGPGKPVGLVFIHVEAPDRSEARRRQLPGDREAIRARAASIALHLVRQVLSRSGEPPA